MDAGWEFWGRAVSRSDGSSHRIDRHARTGSFRCDCASFRWAKAPKGCFHTRAAEQEADAESRGGEVEMPQTVRDEALALVLAMLRAAGVVVPDTKAQAMASVLEPRLANGPVQARPDPAAAVRGQRMIEVD